MRQMQAYFMVVRYVPRILREEFVNVGVVLSCPEVGFQAIEHLPGFGEDSRAKALDGDGLFVRHALTKLRHNLAGYSLESMLGDKLAPEGKLTLEGMRALYHAYCNNIQFSPPKTVLTDNPSQTLSHLYDEYVGQREIRHQTRYITRTVIRRSVHQIFSEYNLFDLGLEKDYRLPLPTEPTVDLAYKNRVWHLYQAISFAGNERSVVTAVNAYRQTARDARESGAELQGAQFMVLGYQPQNPSRLVRNLEVALKDDGIGVVDYREAPEIAKEIRRELEAHQPLMAQ